MKKIISLIAAVAMFATMSITSFAASATIELESKTVTVADGTQDVTLDVTFTMAEEAVVGIIALPFELPDGVTFASYDTTAFAAFCDELYDDSDGTTITIMDDDMEATVSGSFTIPVTFTVDTSAAAVYDIVLTAGDTMIADADFEPYNDADNPPTATITVAAPAVEKTTISIPAATSFETSEHFMNGDVESYHAGFVTEFTVSEDNYPVAALLLGDEQYKVDLGTTIQNATVKVAVNVLNVPATKTLTSVAITPVAE